MTDEAGRVTLLGTMPEADSDAPESVSSTKDVWAARAKAYGTVIAAVGGLVTASAAILKPRDDSATKASYTALATGLEKLGAETTQNHDDLVALRGYLAAKEGAPVLSLAMPDVATTLVTPIDGSAPVTPWRAPKVLAAPAKPKVVHLSDVVVVGTLGAIGAGAPSPPAEPPEVHAAPTPMKAASFDEVLKSAR